MKAEIKKVIDEIERNKVVRGQDLIHLVRQGVPALYYWSQSGHDYEEFVKIIKEMCYEKDVDEC